MKRTPFALALGLTITLVGASLSQAISAQAATPQKYHVDCSQKRNGNGTSSPWNSLTAVRKHGEFAPGDRIMFKRGTSCRGRLVTSGSGTAASHILIGAEGRGALPLIRGGGTADWTGAVELRNQQYWTIQDLAVTNTAGGRSSRLHRAGVLVWNDGGGVLGGITVQRLSVSNVASNMSYKGADPREWGGIVAVTIARGGTNRFNQLTVADNTVSSVGRTGIMVSNHGYPRQADRSVRITSNRVDRSRGDGIVLRGSIGGRIDNNRVSNASSEWPCSECGRISPLTANAAIWTALSDSVRIDHNEAYGTKYLGGDGEGLDVDASAKNAIVEYNYAHDNEGGGIIFCGAVSTTVRFNIFENNKKSAIAFIGSMPATDTSIYNNTIYASRATNARTVRYFNGAHGKGIKFFNNIVYNFGRGSYMWPTKVWSRSNTYVGSHSAGEPHGAGYSHSAPGLKNPGTGKHGRSSLGGYRPAHPSSFRKGIAIPASVKTDFFGKRISAKHPPRGAAG